jgi:hypothetical protein
MEAVVEIVPSPPLTQSGPILGEPPSRLRKLSESSLAFGAKYLGVIISGSATTFLAFVTLIDYFQLPTTPTHRVLAALGLLFIACLVAVASSFPTILRVKRSAAEQNQYRELNKDLSKRLRDAMEEVVQGWASGLLDGLEMEGSLEVDEALEVELHVFVPSGHVYRVIASSAERISPVRRIELKTAEGVVATAYEKRNPLVVLLDGETPGTLWSRKGKKLGPQPPLRDENSDRCHPRVQWVYATPIYESGDGVLESERPLGVLTIDGLNTSAGELYFKPEFHLTVEGVAAQLGPYLSALRTLLPTARG